MDASWSPDNGDSALQVNVPASPDQLPESNTSGTRETILAKGMPEYNTNMRTSGSGMPSDTSAGRTQLAPLSQPSPSLSSAVPRTGINTTVKQEVTQEVGAASRPQGQAREVIVINDSSEDESEDRMGIEGTSETVLPKPNKHSVPGTDDEARPVKRIRLAALEPDVSQAVKGAVELSSELAQTCQPKK